MAETCDAWYLERVENHDTVVNECKGASLSFMKLLEQPLAKVGL